MKITKVFLSCLLWIPASFAVAGQVECPEASALASSACQITAKTPDSQGLYSGSCSGQSFGFTVSALISSSYQFMKATFGFESSGQLICEYTQSGKGGPIALVWTPSPGIKVSVESGAWLKGNPGATYFVCPQGTDPDDCLVAD